MRLYAYEDRRGEARLGVLARGGLLTGSQLEKRGGLGSGRHGITSSLDLSLMLRFADDWADQLETATRRALKAGAEIVPIEQRRPLPVISRPGKIVCVGLNYGDHVAEGGRAAPERPLLFAKFGNTIVGDGDAIVRPNGTHALDLEVELGVVIGKRARRVAEADALAHVAGYVVANDVSARDWQGTPQALREGEKGDGQWLRAKGSDTFLPVGPVFVTPGEVDPAAGLSIRSWRVPAHAADGVEAEGAVLMQDGTTSDMLFTVPQLISFISGQITLEPGDLVITGTPAGVGVFREPPVFLEPGDRARCEIEGIGSVENPVVDWTDDPRRS
jgi:2-keto-4-pentenoate hydratase/2-oxohepta-3-ene-1,7-dioic acid hydratase in catechol pathway